MYYLGVDTGGTFTDFVALNARSGAITTFKVPSVPEDPARAVLAGIERLRDACGIDPSRIVRFIFGTTVATNAVLEHKGARTALVATRGHAGRHRDSAPVAQPPLRSLHPQAPAAGAPAMAFRGGRTHRRPGRGGDAPDR